MNVIADDFKNALNNETISIDKAIDDAMKRTTESKRHIVAYKLLKIAAEQSEKKDDWYLFQEVVLGISRHSPNNETIIDLCAKTAEDYRDNGLKAAVLLTRNPNDKNAIMNLLDETLTIVKKDPDVKGLYYKGWDTLQFLDTVSGHKMVLNVIENNPNDRIIADKACKIVHHFRDVSDSIRVSWAKAIVDANPGNQMVTDMAFTQADKVSSSWSENMNILSSIAIANHDNPDVLNKIRKIAEKAETKYPNLQPTRINEYKGRLLSLTCPLDKEMSERLIKFAYNATNNAKIDIYSKVLAANPRNEDIAMRILRDPFLYKGAGYNTGYTVNKVFSKVLEANPNNKKVLDLAIERTEAIKTYPDIQGKWIIDDAVKEWKSNSGWTMPKLRTKSKKDDLTK